MSTYAYLGPAGTFTEAALNQLVKPGDTKSAYANTTAALDAVRSGAVVGALVPIENSVEGFVARTLDELVIGEPLVITAETTLPVEFALIAQPGVTLQEITKIATHPHAEAQCRTYIAKNLPHAEILVSSSTAAAAEEIAQSQDRTRGAIAAKVAADHYGLSVLAEDIGDNTGAVTRFVLVTKVGKINERTGHDRTSLAIFIASDHAGALLEILNEFAVRGVNLTFIQSRPTGAELGSYHFLIDVEGHISDARIGDALMGLKRICEDVRFLGSYPRADKYATEVLRGRSDKDFTDASTWLSAVRNGNLT
ncbi:MAG: prephenate dehydratase [Actinobacteria bacterium]|uniref:prephenate dehydratase n=1 Tax=freshwater metagenome TaxID=449393 RepID=A0A6J7BJ62_9ZZZZ|nr:prephenate dehydratase [Actinomycetota bacterium]MSY52035.1 prephenate dehydratase [Actinomycetota bacterium]MSY87835.1 prephenate dehydratase [Actinomycetota bacterium]NBP92219.1 prephenate dehydratase [Actinomycetota bacterium]